MSLLAVIGLVLVGATNGTPVDVVVTLEPPEAPFHRQVQFSIVVEAPADLEVQLPQMVEKFGGLEASDIRRNTESLRRNRRRITETYVLDPILIGDYKIDPVEITWGEGESIVVPSPALRVRDLTEEEREAAERFEPNADPVSVESALLRRWKLWAFAGAVVLLALGLLAYRLWWRKREGRAPAPPAPWEVAYQRLRELDERQLSKSGKYEPYYVDLSAILRYYIEDRFHLRAPEQTTPEFLASSARSGLLGEAHQRLVAGFLRHCDMVKFAQYVPALDEMERSFALVLEFVDDTAPQPEAAEQEAAA